MTARQHRRGRCGRRRRRAARRAAATREARIAGTRLASSVTTMPTTTDHDDGAGLDDQPVGGMPKPIDVEQRA